METRPWNKIAAGHDTIHDIFHGKNLSQTTFNEYFKWAFVRNPYDRIVSAYESCHEILPLVKEFKEFIEILYSQKEKIKNLPYIKWSGLPKIDIPVNRIHFFPMTPMFMLDGEIQMDFIGKVENLPHDWFTVCDKLCIWDKTLSHNNKRHNNPRNRNSHYKDLYDPDLQKKVYEIYEEDFLNFGYSSEL
jgi:hypothetical protein